MSKQPKTDASVPATEQTVPASAEPAHPPPSDKHTRAQLAWLLVKRLIVIVVLLFLAATNNVSQEHLDAWLIQPHVQAAMDQSASDLQHLFKVQRDKLEALTEAKQELKAAEEAVSAADKLVAESSAGDIGQRQQRAEKLLTAVKTRDRAKEKVSSAETDLHDAVVALAVRGRVPSEYWAVKIKLTDENRKADASVPQIGPWYLQPVVRGRVKTAWQQSRTAMVDQLKVRVQQSKQLHIAEAKLKALDQAVKNAERLLQKLDEPQRAALKEVVSLTLEPARHAALDEVRHSKEGLRQTTEWLQENGGDVIAQAPVTTASAQMASIRTDDDTEVVMTSADR